MKQPRRAAIYVRISDDKAEDAAGVGRQEADCRALAERQGWSVGEVFVENDTSAYKRRTVQLADGTTSLRVVRPAFRQMLDGLNAGALEGLVAYDLDRIARDPRDLEDLIDVVESRKIPTRSVTGSLDLGSDAGITMARVMVAIANKSSRDSSRRIARKHLELAEQGKTGGGGIRSFGYERDGVTVNEAEAQVLRQIAADLLGGASLSGVARQLNEQGVATVRGGAWGARSIHSVITKPRVAGLREHQGEVVGEAVWPAVLDRDTWEQVRIRLQSRAQGATNRMRFWLTGILVCGKCERRLISSHVTSSRTRYWCATPRGGCGKIAVAAPQAEVTVEGLLLGALRSPEVLAALRFQGSTAGAEQARKDAAADEAQLKELAVAWARRQVSMPEYLAARGEIESRLRQTRLLSRAALPAAVREIADGDPGAAWERFDPAQRREVARVVFPSGIRVDPLPPDRPRTFDPARLVPVDWQPS